MRMTYDQRADAVYIYLTEKRQVGMVKKQYHVMPVQTWGMINLDYDSSGRLIGIEVLGASKRLTQDFLNAAEIIG